MVRSVTPFSTFVIFAMIICACYAREFFICFVKGFVIFPEVKPMYFFVMCVVTSTSLPSEALGNADFRDLAFPPSP